MPAPSHIGRYRLLHRLGRGAMGEVYEAVLEGPQGFRKPVALKVLPAGTPPSSLVHEARLGAMLSHPHVVAIHELGSHEGRWFISMELVKGPTIFHLLKQGPLAPAHILEVGLHVTAGLAHIHALKVNGQAAGLVHRDIKGSNLLLDPSGLVKIADLGIARLVGTGAQVAGTPGFMAPEQLDGEEDHRADLFSLGVLLYRMTTRRLPFGKGRAALLKALHANTLLADASFLAPVDEAIPGLGEVLRGCLAVHPIDRYPHATALHGALKRLRATTPQAGPLHTLVEGNPSLAPSGEPSGHVLSDQPTRLLAPGHLPGSADRFVGREDERLALEALLNDAPLVTLVGPGGMGKTRLSLEVARGVSRRRQGGAWFCDLSEARSPLGLCAAVAQVLDIPLANDDPVERIGHALAGRGPLLLLLDNLEQVIEAARAVVPVWRALAPDTTLLCTSQVALRVPGEAVHPLGPLSVEAGVRLFQLRASRPPTEAERPIVAQLVGRLDGLPLAIELAAARTRVLSAQRVLDHLEDRFKVLAGGQTHRPARHRSLQASLDTSFELLQPWAAAAMSQLAVCHGGFTLEAADAILDLSAWPQAPWALDLVDTLVEHSLLRFDPSLDRFRMLQTIQDYARRRAPQGLIQAAEARHGQWFAQLGSPDALLALAQHGGGARRVTLKRELENTVIAARRAIERADLDVAAQASLASWSVLTLHGPIAVGRELLEQVLTLPGAQERYDLRLERLRSLSHQGALREAAAGLQRLAQEAPGVAAWLARGELIRALGDLGETRRAMTLSTQELREVRPTGDPVLLAPALRRRANLCRVLGHFERALDYASEALPLYRYLGDHRGEAISLGNMGTMLELTGQLDEARQVYERALALHREAEDRRNEASVLSNLGSLALNLGRHAEARRLLKASVKLHREVGNRHDEAIALGNLGLTHFVVQEHETAQRLLEQASALAKTCGDRTVAAIFEANLGGLLRLNGHPRRALETLMGTLPAARGVGDLRLIGFVEGELGATHLQLGDLQAAEKVLIAGESHLRESGDPLELAKLLTVTAELCAQRGELSRAKAILQEAETIAHKLTVAPDSVLSQRIAEVRGQLL